MLTGILCEVPENFRAFPCNQDNNLCNHGKCFISTKTMQAYCECEKGFFLDFFYNLNIQQLKLCFKHHLIQVFRAPGPRTRHFQRILSRSINYKNNTCTFQVTQEIDVNLVVHVEKKTVLREVALKHIRVTNANAQNLTLVIDVKQVGLIFVVKFSKQFWYIDTCRGSKECYLKIQTKLNKLKLEVVNNII